MDKEKQTKSEVLGRVLLDIGRKVEDILYKRGRVKESDSSIQGHRTYDKGKEIMFWVSLVFGFIFMVYIVSHMDELTMPTIKYPSGEVIQGNCDFIEAEYYRANERIKDEQAFMDGLDMMNPDDMWGEFDNFESGNFNASDNPLYDLSPLNLSCPLVSGVNDSEVVNLRARILEVEGLLEKERGKQCPPCVCEICTRCPTWEMSREDREWLINDCRIKKGASVYQAGSVDACRKVMTRFGFPNVPKYSTKPSGIKPIMYGSGGVVDDGLICFKDSGSQSKPDMEFYLNNSIWMLGQSNCTIPTKSMIWVHKK